MTTHPRLAVALGAAALALAVPARAEDATAVPAAPASVAPPSESPSTAPVASEPPSQPTTTGASPAEPPPSAAPPAAVAPPSYSTTPVVGHEESTAAAPNPTPGRPRSAPYVHDGFFGRLSIGPGLFRASTDTANNARRFSGGVVSIEAAIGGTPAPGLVLGGSVRTSQIFSLSATNDVAGTEPTLDGVHLALNALGFFADLYPDPKGGLNFHVFAGLADLATSRPQGGASNSPSGYVLAGGAGYEWFVDRQVSFGVHAQITAGPLEINETAQGARTQVTVLVPAILVGVTYH